MTVCNSSIFVGLRLWAAAILAILAMAIGSPPASARVHSGHLTLVVPGAEGGSWDLTAKAMKEALEAEGIVDRVTLVRYPGAGGLIGLSNFVTRHRGEEDVLLVGGLVMLSSALREETAENIQDVQPVARLTNEWSIIFTNRRSPIRSLDDLVSTLHNAPGALRWGGGTLGGPDHGLLWNIARSTGASLDDVTYFGRTGRASVVDLLAEGRIDVGVIGYAEFQRFNNKSQLQVLGVAAPHQLPGIDAPTLREAGVDVTMMNWRGVFGAPGIDAAARARLTAIVAAMAQTPTWRSALERGDWSNAYLDGPAFAKFVDGEQTHWRSVLTPPAREPAAVPGFWERAARLPLALVLGALALIAAVTALLLWRLHQRREAAVELERQRNELAEKLNLASADAGKQVKDGIDIDFDDWKLSGAEADIAWFMLRGLPMREIATLRGTSERTVRQQAQAIYRKAGLEGRSDLAGRVLERFI